MMKFKYIGDEEEPQSIVFMQKYHFEKGGDYVEVDDRAATKLRGIKGFKQQLPVRKILKRIFN